MSVDGARVAAAHAGLGELEREVLALTFATSLRDSEVAEVLGLAPQIVAEVCVSSLLELLDAIEGSSRARRLGSDATCQAVLSAWFLRREGDSSPAPAAASAELHACSSCAADLEALDRAVRYYTDWGRVSPAPSLRSRARDGARLALESERLHGRG